MLVLKIYTIYTTSEYGYIMKVILAILSLYNSIIPLATNNFDFNSSEFDFQRFNLVTEPGNKLAYMTTTEFVKTVELMHLRDGKMSVKFLDEVLKPAFVTFSMPLFSPFFEEFKNIIQRLIEAGICPKHLDGKKDGRDYERTDNEVPALVLNMEDLAIGFLVCLVPLGLSVVAFICELSVPKMKALTIKTRDLFTFLFLMRAVANVRFSST